MPLPVHKNPLHALKEPSSWAGIAAAITALKTQIAAEYGTYCALAIALCGIAAVLMKNPPDDTKQDVDPSDTDLPK